MKFVKCIGFESIVQSIFIQEYMLLLLSQTFSAQPYTLDKWKLHERLEMQIKNKINSFFEMIFFSD